MRLDPRLAQDIIGAVDNRVDQLLRARPTTSYGIVASVDSGNHRCSVYLSGDPNPSAGFAFAPWERPSVGDRVRVVIDPRGDRYVDKVYALDALELPDPEPVILASGFSHVTSGTYSLTANADQIVSSHTIDTPASGNFRLWIAHRTIWRHSVAANLMGGSNVSGGVGWVSFDQVGAAAATNVLLAGLGWIDSAGSPGGYRASPALLNGQTLTINQGIRASATGTATVYAAAPTYVSNLYSWITRN